LTGRSCPFRFSRDNPVRAFFDSLFPEFLKPFPWIYPPSISPLFCIPGGCPVRSVSPASSNSVMYIFIDPGSVLAQHEIPPPPDSFSPFLAFDDPNPNLPRFRRLLDCVLLFYEIPFCWCLFSSQLLNHPDLPPPPISFLRTSLRYRRTRSVVDSVLFSPKRPASAAFLFCQAEGLVTVMRLVPPNT